MVNYTYITDTISSDVLEEIKQSKVIGLDTETTGLDPHNGKLRLIQINTGINIYIIDLYKCSNWIELRNEELLWIDKIIVGQSLRFELKWLWKYYIDISSCKNLFDLEIVSHVIYNGLDYKYSLKENLNRELGIEISKDEQVSNWDELELTESQLDYAAIDVLHLLDCRLVLLEKIKKLKLVDILRIELKNIYVTASLEYNGIYLDVQEWEDLIPELEKELEIVKKDILTQLKDVYYQGVFIGEPDKLSVNIESSKQLLKKLNDIGVPCGSTNENELKLLSVNKYPILKSINRLRKINKEISTYLSAFRDYVNPVTGRIHYSIRQLAAITGRISSIKPAILTIPREKRFRQAFKPQNVNHYFLDFDFSQIEARLGALLSNEIKMIEIFNNNLDLYKATAAMEMGLSVEDWELLDDKVKKDSRQNAKSEALGLLYGMGTVRYRDYCEQTFGIVKTEYQAKKERNKFLYETYPGLPVWHKKCTEGYESKRELRNINNRFYQSLDVIPYNLHINFGVQSLATDIMKEALNQIFFFLKKELGVVPLFDRCGIWLIAYVHDQGTFEGEKEILEKYRDSINNILVSVAEEMTEHKVKIKVDSGLGINWYESH